MGKNNILYRKFPRKSEGLWTMDPLYKINSKLRKSWSLKYFFNSCHSGITLCLKKLQSRTQSLFFFTNIVIGSVTVVIAASSIYQKPDGNIKSRNNKVSLIRRIFSIKRSLFLILYVSKRKDHLTRNNFWFYWMINPVYILIG